MPVMSVEVELYLNELADLDAIQLLEKVDAGAFPMESDCKWIQNSYRDAFRLLRSGFFPLNSQTEGNVMKQVWSCVDTCFDFSPIKSVSGEKCSRASADAGNKDRCLSHLGRQSPGRKMDYLFTTKTDFEVGCGECALVGGIKTTKELVDAGFKMPKVMKDMANSLLLNYPGLAHDICIVSLYIGGDAMQLFTLDFPAGYVARLDGFGPVYSPKEENHICFALPSLLQMVLSSRQLMEEMQCKIQNYKTVKPINRIGVVPKQIVPTFIPAAASVRQKKRKVSS
ncbi:hypothetical protein MAM1_0056c03604 [Mucor ambiguus]|uniref:Uncharacterized protein n=1 Tax=Mucor ambiguus TaxID=91626 RepID=A0A0C9M9V4_9FUNG|nr:hypothetical protein MAM1_0056c03604 [Mucor ambiguus]